MRTERTIRGAARAQRGSSLVEVIIAMALTMVGAVGVANLNNMGLRYVGDGRRMTRAVAIAEDLASQISMWGYTDARLSNGNASNDDDLGDTGFALERTATSGVTALVDHVEADLGAGWQGIPAADLVAGGYERFWNVSFNDPSTPGTLLDANANTVADGMRIAVIVRWPQGSGFRRVVVYVTKPNPGDAL